MLSYNTPPPPAPIMADPLSAPSPEPMPSRIPATTSKATTNGTHPQHRHIWIVTGPAGCGKTTVAEYLSKHFSLPYLEGDSVSFEKETSSPSPIRTTHLSSFPLPLSHTSNSTTIPAVKK